MAPDASPWTDAPPARISRIATERSLPSGSYNGHGSARHGGTFARAATTRPSASSHTKSSGNCIPFIPIGCRSGDSHFRSKPSTSVRVSRPAQTFSTRGRCISELDANGSCRCFERDGRKPVASVPHPHRGCNERHEDPSRDQQSSCPTASPAFH
jgi:hypothetical protein